MSGEQKRRVLVVDDDPYIRELLVAVLRRRALIVDEAADGREALQLILEHQYSVILLDLLMPGSDGFDVLNGLGGPELTSPPVVLVITGADRGAIEQLDARRIHGIVRKPFDPDELSTLVVACAEIRNRGPFGAMAIATMIAGGLFLALLNRFSA